MQDVIRDFTKSVQSQLFMVFTLKQVLCFVILECLEIHLFDFVHDNNVECFVVSVDVVLQSQRTE